MHLTPILSTLMLITVLALDPLSTAKELGAEKYEGWTYGASASNNQVDCTTFMVDVIENVLGASIDQDARNLVHIRDIDEVEEEREELQKLILLAPYVALEDERTKGVQHALVENGWGNEVEIDDIQRGDLVQYWLPKEIDGHAVWLGHSAVVESVYQSGSTKRMKLYGAHRSTNQVGSTPDSQDLRIIHDETRKIYAVRMH